MNTPPPFMACSSGDRPGGRASVYGKLLRKADGIRFRTITAWRRLRPPAAVTWPEGLPRVLLTWWGLPGRGTWGPAGGDRFETAGDLVAVANLALWLRSRGAAVVIAGNRPVVLPGIATCVPEAVDPAVADACAFVCGPLAAHPELDEFLARCRGRPLLAAGVSLLPDEAATNRRFCRILARDGGDDASFDLALADPWYALHGLPSEPRDGIALCFAGPQQEYRDARQNQQAEALLAQAVPKGERCFTIDTVLRRGNGVERIFHDFARARVVLTTRLHGSLLALRSGTPCVTVDQVPGGAKVSAVLRSLGYPLLFTLDEATPPRLAAAVAEALDPAFAPRLAALRQAAIARANGALRLAGCAILEAATRQMAHGEDGAGQPAAPCAPPRGTAAPRLRHNSKTGE